MHISVIIPTLNEQDHIARAIKSAWDIGTEGPKVAEVVVVDGGSTDLTTSIAKDSGAWVFKSEKGRGIQLAKGIDSSSGEWILMLHADCVLDSSVGTQLKTVFQGNQLIHGAMRQKIDRAGIKYRLLEWGNRKRIEWFSLPYGDQAIFMRRTAYEEVGGMPIIPLMEDVELMTRLRCKAKPALIDGPVHISARRWEKSGVVRQTLKNWFLLVAYRLGVSAERIADWYR